jgi:flagellar hook-associated protein 1 FlgK
VSSELRIETLNEFYEELVAEVGLLTEEANESQEFSQTLVDELGKLRDSVSGVNLDEEMTELLQIQRAYEAAAKLITTADEMLQSLLEMR